MLRKAQQLLDAARKTGAPMVPMDEWMLQELSWTCK